MLIGGYLGEADKMSAASAPPSVQSAFKALNIIYNFADMLNKTAFSLIIWSAAVAETEK